MSRDDAALATFIEAQHPQVLGTLQLVVGDLHLAEELAAEAMARVASHWQRIAQMDAPGPYVHRISMNLAHSWFRRRAAGRRALERHGASVEVHHDADTADVLAVREAVAALPDRQRACVALHHLADLSTVEVGAVLGVAPATVRSNLRDARVALRAVLGEDLEVHEEQQQEPGVVPAPTSQRGMS